MSFFIEVAFQIKNFFIGIAIIFLIIGVLKLLFSGGSDEDVKKWKNNIIWVSIGVFIMQIAFSVWNTLILKDPTSTVSSFLGWQFWVNIFLPMVALLQMVASFGFILMMIYAFYTIITGGGDEEKLKKGKNTVIYALIGFFLIRVPEAIVRAIYGSPDCKETSIFTIGNCEIKSQRLEDAIGIVGKIFNFVNGFLAVISVLLILYAGWLVLISGGDEEKLKKAKNIILYIVIGFILLVGSHAIFRFFILQG